MAGARQAFLGRRCEVAQRFRDAEVEELHEPQATEVLREEDVVRLHVAVDDAVLVRGGERAEDLRDDVDGLGFGQRSDLGQVHPQGAPHETLHDQIGTTIVEEAEVVHLADAGVPERAGVARLLVEARDRDLVALGGTRLHHLDRDRLVEREVPRFVHGRHPAAPEHRAHLVFPPEDGADQRVHRLGRRADERLFGVVAHGRRHPLRMRL